MGIIGRHHQPNLKVTATNHLPRILLRGRIVLEFNVIFATSMTRLSHIKLLTTYAHIIVCYKLIAVFQWSAHWNNHSLAGLEVNSAGMADADSLIYLERSPRW